MLEKALPGGEDVGTQHDEGHRDFTPSFMGATDHSGLKNGGVLIEHALDFGAGDVLAARHDHVLESIDNVEIAVGVASSNVSGMEPTAGEGGGGGLRIAPIAFEHLGTAYDDLTAFSCRH